MVGAVSLAREHLCDIGHDDAYRNFPPGQKALHRIQVEISDTRGADDPDEPGVRGLIARKAGMTVAEAKLNQHRALLEIRLLEGEGRAVVEEIGRAHV